VDFKTTVKCRRRVPHDDEPDGDDQPLSKKIELQTIICVGIPYWRFWNFSTGVNIPILNSVARASLRVVDAAQFYWSLAAIPLARSCSQKQRHAGASSPRKAIPARMAPSDDWGHIRTRSRLDRLLGVFVDRVYREFAFLKSMPHASLRRTVRRFSSAVATSREDRRTSRSGREGEVLPPTAKKGSVASLRLDDVERK
jgi:hypothetical protein